MALWFVDLGGVDLMSLHFPPRVGCRLLNREGYELVGPNYDSLSCMLPSDRRPPSCAKKKQLTENPLFLDPAKHQRVSAPAVRAQSVGQRVEVGAKVYRLS